MTDLKHRVMGRMEWFRDLKRVFNRIALNDSSNQATCQGTVPLSEFVQELSNTTLPLEDNRAYYSKHTVLALSLGEVLQGLVQVQASAITWDHVIDVIIQASLLKKKQPASEQPTPSRLLEISYPQDKLSTVPTHLLGAHLQYVNLAGNALSHTNWPFPTGLLVLNLAGNEIKDAHLPTALPNLKVLNLSNNRLCKVDRTEQFLQLTEAYFGYNSINDLTTLRRLSALKVLDLSYNDLAYCEDLATLPNTLAAVKLKGNPVCRTDEYLSFVQRKLSHCRVDPLNIVDYSEFRAEYFPFVPLRRPPKLVEPPRSSEFQENQTKTCIPVFSNSTPSFQYTQGTTLQSSLQNYSNNCSTQNTYRSLRIPSKASTQPYQELLMDSSQQKPLRRTPVIFSTEEQVRPPSSGSVLGTADSRIAGYPRSSSKMEFREGKRKFVVTKEEILQAKCKTYDNPIKALMIGPPNVGRPNDLRQRFKRSSATRRP